MEGKFSERELNDTAVALVRSTLLYDYHWKYPGGLISHLLDEYPAIPYLKARHFDILPKK